MKYKLFKIFSKLRYSFLPSVRDEKSLSFREKLSFHGKVFRSVYHVRELTRSGNFLLKSNDSIG